MKRKIKITLSVVLLGAIIWVVFLGISAAALPATANAMGDKYDGDCTGLETSGRCADKCPAPEFVRGYDKDTGAAICGYVTGCPYGDSIPLGPECDKFAPQTQPDPQAPVINDAPVEAAAPTSCMGGK